MVFEIGFVTGLSSNFDEGRRCKQNNLPNSSRSLMMPFVRCNGPSSFQATVNDVFKPFLHKFTIVFFDDVLVYSKIYEDHLSHLDQTFQTLMAV